MRAPPAATMLAASGGDRGGDDMAGEGQQRRNDADPTGWPGRPVIYEVNTAIWFDAGTVLEDRQWPMARPYRRLAAAPMPGVTTAREARGVTEPPSPVA